MNKFDSKYTYKATSDIILINPEEYVEEIVKFIYRTERTEGMTFVIALQTIIEKDNTLQNGCGLVTNSWKENNRQFEEGYMFIFNQASNSVRAWKILTGPGVEEQDVYVNIDGNGSSAGTAGIYKVARVGQVGEQVAGFFEKDNRWYFQFPAKSAWVYGKSEDMYRDLPKDNLVEVISKPYIRSFQLEENN